MTKPQENPDAMTEPVLQPAAEPSPGTSLRSAREARGLSQAQVGEALHLTVHYINALENDLYQKLPGRTFAKGYLKSYARLLEIDAVELIARFDRYMDAREEPQSSAYRSISRHKHHDQNVRWLAVATCLLVMVVAGAWWFGREAPGGALPMPRVSQQQPAAPGVATPARGRIAELIASSQEAPAAAANGARLEDAGTALPGDPAAAPDGSPALDSEAETNATAVAATAASEPGAAALNPSALDSAVASDAAVPAPGADTPVASVAQAGAAASPDTAAAPGATDRPDTSATPDATAAPGQTLGAPAASTLSVLASEGGSGRQLSLGGEGDDTLVITLHGTSWLAVRNHANDALFNDNLHDGDELTLRGQAPFNLVIGDAHQVQLRFNARPVNLTGHIRADRTARLSLQP